MDCCFCVSVCATLLLSWSFPPHSDDMSFSSTISDLQFMYASLLSSQFPSPTGLKISWRGAIQSWTPWSMRWIASNSWTASTNRRCPWRSSPAPCAPLTLTSTTAVLHASLHCIHQWRCNYNIYTYVLHVQWKTFLIWTSESRTTLYSGHLLWSQMLHLYVN